MLDTDWLSYGWPPPSGDLWEGSYIDDPRVLRIAQGPAFDDPEGVDITELNRIRDAHRAAGTVLHERKRVTRSSKGDVWGAELDGVEGTDWA